MSGLLSRERGSFRRRKNQRLNGWPVRTIVHFVAVMDNGKIVGPGGHGKYLWRRIGQPPILGKLS